MKNLLFLIALSSFTSIFAQTPEAQKAWETFTTPSAGHKQLEKQTGFWIGEAQYWMDSSAQPIKTQAYYEIEMILNGLFQEMNYTSRFLNNTFTGKSITGYNNHKKEYEIIWVDGMGSGFVKMAGFWDEGTQTYNYKGTQTDAITGKDVAIRQETKIISTDHFVITMYSTNADDIEIKFMEGSFKRSKKVVSPPIKPKSIKKKIK